MSRKAWLFSTGWVVATNKGGLSVQEGNNWQGPSLLLFFSFAVRSNCLH